MRFIMMAIPEGYGSAAPARLAGDPALAGYHLLPSRSTPLLSLSALPMRGSISLT